MKREAHITGRKVYLRALRRSDINERYLSWINDPDVVRYMETGTFPATPEDLAAYYEKMEKSSANVIFAIIAKERDLHIGNIKLGAINWIHRYADLGIMVGDKRCWRKGYGREACMLALAYGFEMLNLNKIILGVYGNHSAAIRLYSEIGFEAEGRIKNILNLGDRYVDKVLMGISRSRFLKSKQLKAKKI